ncbi:DUF5336 domain-containing protein [Gulosibacter bifidus]|uniref:DUF5336 domain-containing protein n=1 Tax=Gulosibacter bifidus TaxID=272239 RepID=A0ABW5RKM2_9MICO|nr:DUF5336 domain-containing protein [Gulosibacter bifidus]
MSTSTPTNSSNQQPAAGFAMPKNLFGFGPIAVAAAGVLGFISVFLPQITIEMSDFSITTMESTTETELIGYFTEGAAGEGVLLLIAFVLAIALGAVAILKQAKELTLAAAGAGIVVGLFALLRSINIMSSADELAFLADGGPAFGAYLMLFAALVLIAGGVLCVVGASKLPSMLNKQAPGATVA